jgi:Tfp pilus assembly protein PilV
MRSDEGISLVETLVAIAILGIAVLAIVGALGVAAHSSSLHRAQADSEAGLRSAAEAIHAAPYKYCPLGGLYSTGGATAPARIHIAVVDVEYWNATGFQGHCPPEDSGIQRITLEATADGGVFSRALQVVKRRP